MKPVHFLLFVLLGSFGMPTISVGAPREIWLAFRTKNGGGTGSSGRSGTSTNPIDVSTAAKFDNFWESQRGIVFGTWTPTSDVVRLSTPGAAANLRVGEFVNHRYGWIDNGARYNSITGVNVAANECTLAQRPSAAATNDAMEVSVVSAAAVEGATDPAIFHLGASPSGKPYTTSRGITWQPGWKLEGAGNAVTEIQLLPGTGSGAAASNYGGAVIASNAPTDGIEIRDVTFDGGVLLASSTITSGAFRIPATGGTVTVTVTNPALFTAGGDCYLQDMVIDGPHHQHNWWGILGVQSVAGDQVTLINSQGFGNSNPGSMYTRYQGAGSTVPGTVGLFNVNTRIGMYLGGSHMRFTNVVVQNVAVPTYEGPLWGIWAVAGQQEVDNVMDHCYLTDVWGGFGWGIAPSGPYIYASTPFWATFRKATITVGSTTGMVATPKLTAGSTIVSGAGLPNGTDWVTAINSPTSVTLAFGPRQNVLNKTLSFNPQPRAANASYVQLDIKDSVFQGNGWYLGLAPIGWQNSVVSGCTFTGWGAALYTDTGPVSGIKFSNDVFDGFGGISLNGGNYSPWTNVSMDHCTIHVGTGGSQALQLGSPVENCTFDYLRMTGGGQNSVMITNAASSRIQINHSIVDTTFGAPSIVSASVGTEVGNQDPTGKGMTIGLGSGSGGGSSP